MMNFCMYGGFAKTLRWNFHKSLKNFHKSRTCKNSSGMVF